LEEALTEPSNSTTPLLRIPAVAEKLSVSRRYVLDLIKSGQLEAVALGQGASLRHYRVSEDALTAYLAARTVKRRQTS
jgi:excisionase family DNA binding protein